MLDSMIVDGLWDAYENFHMGETAELVAEKYGISRQEQDEFAFESHAKRCARSNRVSSSEQIVPVEMRSKKGAPVVIKTDESPREERRLRPSGS